MKYFTLIFALFLFACNSPAPVKPAAAVEKVIVYDTICDSTLINYLSNKVQKDSFVIAWYERRLDTVWQAYQNDAYTLDRIERYYKIIDKNSSQAIFEKGWIRRALQYRTVIK